MKPQRAIKYYDHMAALFRSIAQSLSETVSEEHIPWDTLKGRFEEIDRTQKTLEEDPPQPLSSTDTQELCKAAERAAAAHGDLGPLLRGVRGNMLQEMERHGKSAAATRIYQQAEQPLPRFVDRQG